MDASVWLRDDETGGSCVVSNNECSTKKKRIMRLGNNDAKVIVVVCVHILTTFGNEVKKSRYRAKSFQIFEFRLSLCEEVQASLFSVMDSLARVHVSIFCSIGFPLFSFQSSLAS